MIEVEAADEVLVRLAVAGVLGHDDAGNGLQQLALAREGPAAKIDGPDMTLGGAGGHANEIVSPADDSQRSEDAGGALALKEKIRGADWNARDRAGRTETGTSRRPSGSTSPCAPERDPDRLRRPPLPATSPPSP